MDINLKTGYLRIWLDEIDDRGDWLIDTLFAHAQHKTIPHFQLYSGDVAEFLIVAEDMRTYNIFAYDRNDNLVFNEDLDYSDAYTKVKELIAGSEDGGYFELDTSNV